MADISAEGHRQQAQASKALAKSVDNLLQDVRSDWGATQETLIRNRLLEMPVSCRHGYLRAMLGKSPTAAIKAFCLMCVSWEREGVKGCTATACPLFPYRPFT